MIYMKTQKGTFCKCSHNFIFLLFSLSDDASSDAAVVGTECMSDYVVVSK